MPKPPKKSEGRDPITLPEAAVHAVLSLDLLSRVSGATSQTISCISRVTGTADPFDVDEARLDEMLASKPLKDPARRSEFRRAVGTAIGEALALKKEPHLLKQPTRIQAAKRLELLDEHVRALLLLVSEMSGQEGAILAKHGAFVRVELQVKFAMFPGTASIPVGAVEQDPVQGTRELVRHLDALKRAAKLASEDLDAYGFTGRGDKRDLARHYAATRLTQVFREFVGDWRRIPDRDPAAASFVRFLSAALRGTELEFDGAPTVLFKRLRRDRRQ